MALPQEDRRRTTTRLVSLQVGAIIWFAALAICFWVLQVVQHEDYVRMADSNYQRTLARRAPRGVLFDRNGKVLVENRNSYTISIVREDTKDLPRTVRMASAVLGLDVAEVQDIVDRNRREPSYRPIVIVHDASLDQVAAVMARKYELPEISIAEVPTRKYPTDALAAHLFGYVGEADERQVKELGMSRGAIVGMHGVEKIYNALLTGEDGAKRVIVNSMGREITTVEDESFPPSEGRRVQLTIDYDLQKAAEDGFRHAGFNGAALIMDPRNGEVLVHASLPAYDPNNFQATYPELIADKLRPLTNRVLQGRYSPGSTLDR